MDVELHEFSHNQYFKTRFMRYISIDLKRVYNTPAVVADNTLLSLIKLVILGNSSDGNILGKRQSKIFESTIILSSFLLRMWTNILLTVKVRYPVFQIQIGI